MISSKKSKQEVTGVLFLEATLQMCKINIEASSSSLEFGQPSSRVLDLEFESSGLWQEGKLRNQRKNCQRDQRSWQVLII